MWLAPSRNVSMGLASVGWFRRVTHCGLGRTRSLKKDRLGGRYVSCEDHQQHGKGRVYRTS